MGFAAGVNAGIGLYNGIQGQKDRDQQRQQRELEMQKLRQEMADTERARGLRMQLDDQIRGVDPTQDGGSRFMGPHSENAQAGAKPGDARSTLQTRMQLANATGADIAPLLKEQSHHKQQDVFKARSKEFDALGDDGVAKWMEKHSLNSDIPMYGTPEKNGKYTMFVQGRPSVQLSRAEMRQLYVAEGLMDENPMEALKILEAGSDKLRSLAKDLGDFQIRAMTANNQAVHHQAVDERGVESLKNDRARLGMERERLGIARGQAERANWMPEQYVDKDGNVRVFDVNRRGAQPQFQERTMPEGLKPYNPRPPAEIRVNPDGSVTRGSELFVPDPKRPGAYMPAQGLGPNATEQALQKFLQGRDQQGGQPTTAPARGMPLKNPTLHQLRSMAPEAVAAYARSGHPTAIAIMREQERNQEPGNSYGFESGY